MIVGNGTDPEINRSSEGPVLIDSRKYEGEVIAAGTSERSCLKAARADIPWSCCLDLFQSQIMKQK